MRAFSAIHILERTRTQLSVTRNLLFCRAKSAGSGIDELRSSKVVPPSLLATEKEEAKAVLISFLSKQGLSNAVAARTIKKSVLFIDHLVSRLHSVHKSGHPVGQELTALEIQDALIPYLESLLKKHGNVLVDFVENFPGPLVQGKLVAPVSPSRLFLNSMKLKAVSRMSETDPAGQLPSLTVYLMEVGLDLEQIKKMACRCPRFIYYSLEGRIKPLVEFLLDLGIPKSDLPTILTKMPHLCGFRLSEKLIPTMRFFENLGVDKRQWAKLIHRCPWILGLSRQKVEGTVAFFHEMGVSTESVGKIITRFPSIVCYSLEDNLRPTCEYLLSLGVDVAGVLQQYPQIFGLSVEANLKPVTKFFLEKGYSIEEVGTMISRHGILYAYSLAMNVTPKWEFFLTMDYSKEELVKCPHYFGCSLEGRIKPRYALVKESGVNFSLGSLLSLSNHNFDKALKKRMEKMLSNKASASRNCDVDPQPVIEQ